MFMRASLAHRTFEMSFAKSLSAKFAFRGGIFIYQKMEGVIQSNLIVRLHLSGNNTVSEKANFHCTSVGSFFDQDSF